MPERPTIGLFSQAPGNLAHQGGKPFLDPSGVRLRDWMGIDEAAFYDSGRIAIAPMAFCFPGYDGKSPTGKGGDLPPPKVCAPIWRDEVMGWIGGELQLVLLVGAYSQKWHLGERRGRTLTETVAAWRDRVREAEAGGPLILPLPHPSWRNNAWLRKNPWFGEDLLPVLRERVAQALT
nr:uracil-DNA glycosylase family protein [Parvularcula oceani]